MTHNLDYLFRKFLGDQRGSATVEFVLALPILLAMMAFAVQYGNAMSIRNNLDVATRDAARYLARAPLANATGTSIDATFVQAARDMVQDRVLNTKSTITGFTAVSNATGASIDVTIDVPFPLLAWMGFFEETASPSISMKSTENWVRTGDRIVMVPLGG